VVEERSDEEVAKNLGGGTPHDFIIILRGCPPAFLLLFSEKRRVGDFLSIIKKYLNIRIF
jgi:hypothetical protein